MLFAGRMQDSKQAVEKAPSASLRSTASLRRTAPVRLRSSVLRAPRIWDLFDQPVKRVFHTLFSVAASGLSRHLAGHAGLLQGLFIAAADLRVFIFVVNQSAAFFYVYVDPVLAALGCNLKADRVEPAAEAQRQVAGPPPPPT